MRSGVRIAFLVIAGISAVRLLSEFSKLITAKPDIAYLILGIVAVSGVTLVVLILTRNRGKLYGGIPKLRSTVTSLGKLTANTAAPGAITRQYRMNYFDPGENSNKVWIGIAYSDGSFETRFGRVRDEANLVSSRKNFASQYDAENELERKRREKLRKGYKDTVVVDNVVQATVTKGKKDKLSQIAAEEITGAGGDRVTVELIKYLAEVNIHHITHSTSIKYNTKTGAFSTPLGVLTPDAISTARDLLTELRRLDRLKRKQEAKRAVVIRDYFQLVPKDFGTKIPPVEELIATEEQFQEEAAILDALESAIAPNIGKKKAFRVPARKDSALYGRRPKAFQTDSKPLLQNEEHAASPIGRRAPYDKTL